MNPKTLRHIFATFPAQVEQAARMGSGTGAFVGNPETTCTRGERTWHQKAQMSMETVSTLDLCLSLLSLLTACKGILSALPTTIPVPDSILAAYSWAAKVK